MAGFSDAERERIREQLRETGRELLLTYGPEKTTVADVTEPVGIATSSFYLFYDSKAELYLEIVDDEIGGFVETVRDRVAGVDDPRVGLERLLRTYREFAEDNPLVQRLVVDRSYGRSLRADVPPEKLAAVQEETLAELVPLIESLQERSDGLLAEYDPVTIVGLVATVGFLALNREDYEQFDEAYYDRVQELLIASLARGLTAGTPADREADRGTDRGPPDDRGPGGGGPPGRDPDGRGPPGRGPPGRDRDG